MGFHVCEYCRDHTSSGDVVLAFTSGRTWEMPDMILHYVDEHDYRPPPEFVDDVFSGELAGAGRRQTKGPPGRVGYLSGPIPSTWGPGLVVDRATFFAKLGILLERARKGGDDSYARSRGRR